MTVSQPARLVVLAPNWLGDAVMALPLIADIRRAWPETTIAVAGRQSVAALFQMVPDVNETIALQDGGGLRALSTWRSNAAALARGAFDAALLLPNSFAVAWIASRANIPERWGYATDWRSRLLTTAVRVFGGRGLHQAEYYQALGTALGFTAGPRHARLAVSDDSRARADALLLEHGLTADQRFVVMAPGAAYGRAKQWLPMRFAELASLLGRDDVTTVLVGSPADARVCAQIAALPELSPQSTADSRQRSLRSSLDAARPSTLLRTTLSLPKGRDDPEPAEGSLSALQRQARRNAAQLLTVDCGLWTTAKGRVIDLSGKTDLATLAAILSRADAVVANDSGAMHLAAAVGTKVVAVFGPTDQRRTSPLPAGDAVPQPVIVSTDVWCRPCMLRECPIDHRCMTGVSARRVFDACS